MSIDRIRVTWSGFPGGPGVSTFYSADAPTDLAALAAFWSSVAGSLPGDVDINMPSAGDTIDDVTGELTGSWSSGSGGAYGGTAAGAYAAPSGACVDWLTSTVVDGHRLRGRTFLVPLGAGGYQDDGSLDTTVRAALQGQADTLVANADLVIWHRPRVARAADGSRPAVTARAGSHATVTSSLVPDKVVVLRSRRD